MVDKYTKVILTIIAANLTLMTLQGLDLIPQANANTGIQKVVICSFINQDRCADVKLNRLQVHDY